MDLAAARDIKLLDLTDMSKDMRSSIRATRW
jgi:hypothetical protein